MPIIPPAPADLRKCSLYEAFLKKAAPDNGAADKAESFLQSAVPMVDLTIAGPFKEYTLHNRDHSKKLLHLVGQMLTASTMGQLSVLEFLLLIYSAFCTTWG